jgi:glycosyltransferase involved in cell wall biosynthesis
MRILILSDDFPPQSFGGAGYSTFYLACGLKKAGHQIFVITTVRDKKDEGSIDYEGLKVFRIFSNYHERWRAYLSLYNPRTVKKVRKLIQEIKPDIVHAHNLQPNLSYYCLKIAKKFSKAVFFTARDTMSFTYGKLATEKYLKHFNSRVNWQDHLKQAQKRYTPSRNFLIRRCLKYVDKVFAVSNALKGALEQNGIKNVEVSHTGIDVDGWQVSSEKIEEFKKKHKLEGKKVVFFGGRISELKGIEQIKQAMDKIKKEIPETVLLVVGKGGIGWLSGEELRAAYACVDVVIVPSIYLDPFPRMNLEAMAVKKPVVGTCFGGTPEIVQDGITGYVVNPFNVELMAEKILDLLKNPQKAKQFGEAGYQRIKKHFSSEAHVAQTIAWYEKLTSNKN